MRRFALPYLLILLLSFAVIATLVALGARHYPALAAAVPTTAPVLSGTTPLARLLLQIVVILVAARGLGRLFRRLGQPPVIGEIVAGLALGPSLLGGLWPAASAQLFAPASLGPLGLLSQLGVLVFMFLVGLDLDPGTIRHKARTAIVVSHTSIFVPFALGVGLVLVAYPQLGAPGAPFASLALFMGIAMSVTAFPVLARILEDRGLLQTVIGRDAIACAAIDDVSAWCLLALVVALAKGDGLAGVALTVALTALFVAAMLLLVKPLLARWAAQRQSRGADALQISVVLVALLLAATITEVIGIHALFGAFVAGLVMPAAGAFRGHVRERLHAFATIVLLPLFFALSGLRTQLGLIDGAGDWALCGAIVALAVAGKLGGSYVAARLTGAGREEAFTIGALMNTRGLMELIVLNLGYDLGILSPRVFSMMVVMALVTTLMTGPLLTLAQHRAGALARPA
ncbi:cation:proton antiporter domain-containing protein [Solimonas soli]|uniref:cation:proton antiporter domain-containing protein n=1 Tax=Solimonas soli TaxID=413479 RepID=UPI0004B36164|nr:cation:proton antiporter [Solimonas soli]